MNLLKRYCLAALFTVSIAGYTQAAAVVFLVRHAEKAAVSSDNPELSAAGEKRAAALGELLKDAGICEIITTEFKRTQQTAAPLAEAIHVAPSVLAAKDVSACVDRLRALNGNALVVGHSNTIPAILKGLGIEQPPTIPDDDYSELFVLILGDKPQLVQLHYRL